MWFEIEAMSVHGPETEEARCTVKLEAAVLLLRAYQKVSVPGFVRRGVIMLSFAALKMMAWLPSLMYVEVVPKVIEVKVQFAGVEADSKLSLTR